LRCYKDDKDDSNRKGEQMPDRHSELLVLGRGVGNQSLTLHGHCKSGTAYAYVRRRLTKQKFPVLEKIP
jgi:hypothetical protein